MRLSALLEMSPALFQSEDCEISRLILDSRSIQPGDAFIALNGLHQDGRDYIEEAIAKGASAILVEAIEGDEAVEGKRKESSQWDCPASLASIKQSVPLIFVSRLSQNLGLFASRFYHFPAKKMNMIGVTGTNGKTSISHFIAQILSILNQPCGIIGSLGSGFYQRLTPTGFSTPDAISLQASLHQLSLDGAKVIAMEVSSHGIAQGRINAIPFDSGIFTNLTQDHLDYHGNMAAYAAVKFSFLAEHPVKRLIINADDKYGRSWITKLSASKQIFAYGMEPVAKKVDVPFVYAHNVHCSLQGIHAEISSPWGEGKLFAPLIGDFNLSNVLAALTTLCAANVPFPKVLACLPQLQPVAGRMQALQVPNKPMVIIDYAHTPDALEKVLCALRPYTQRTEGQLLCVFGCGGGRDQGKRPKMARVAEKWADKVIITTDNSRHEQPEDIVADILKGFKNSQGVRIVLDRSDAIENSIRWASARDCILIAGKGAEQYQQIGEQKKPFDDVQYALRYLASSG